MRIAPLASVKARLSAYLEECKEEGPIVITRNGKAVAILLAPIDDDDLEGLLLARSPRFQALLDKSRASIQAGKGLSSRQFWDTVHDRRGMSLALQPDPGADITAPGRPKPRRGRKERQGSR
jgi:prevent-host-death family protein